MVLDAFLPSGHALCQRIATALFDTSNYPWQNPRADTHTIPASDQVAHAMATTSLAVDNVSFFTIFSSYPCVSLQRRHLLLNLLQKAWHIPPFSHWTRHYFWWSLLCSQCDRESLSKVLEKFKRFLCVTVWFQIKWTDYLMKYLKFSNTRTGLPFFCSSLNSASA